MKFKNLMNQRFGKITALSSANYTKFGMMMWNCKCECGKELQVPSGYLLRGTTASCGCSRGLGYGEAALNQLYTQYKKGARHRNFEFSLSKDFFKQITQKDCFYCGEKPIRQYAHDTCRKGKYTYNGIDRVDNKKGYTEFNVLPCCKDCNKAKATLLQADFFSMIKRIYERHCQ